MTSEKKIHFAGTQHQRPEVDSPGYIRVVVRGCAGGMDDSCDADCAHGYTWACEECPVLREEWRQEEDAKK